MLSDKEIRRLLWGEAPKTKKTPLVKKVYDKIRKNYKINKSFQNEKECEEHFFKWLDKTFPNCLKKKQYNVKGGRIDIVMECERDIVGIEIKYPKSVGQLQRLKGQVDDYKKTFGKKIDYIASIWKIRPVLYKKF